MRYVKNYDETTNLYECIYTTDDHNRFVSAFNVLMQIIDSAGVTGDDVDALRSLVAQMRSIKTGEFYVAQLHNLFAQAWELVPSIIERITAPPPPPPPAWDVVVDFNTADDLRNFMVLPIWRYPCIQIDGEVKNSVFTYYGPPGQTGTIYGVWEQYRPSKLEIVFRINPVSGSTDSDLAAIQLLLYDGEYWCDIRIYYPNNPSDNIRVYEPGRDVIASVPNVGEWLRFVLDFDNETFTLYDLRGHVLASSDISRYFTGLKGVEIILRASNTDSYKASVSIDKICFNVKEPKPIPNASGIDPYDPTWMPNDGWDFVGEMRLFAPLNYRNWSVTYGEVLAFSTPNGSWFHGGISYDDVTLSRVAVAFRVSLSKVKWMDWVAYVHQGEPPNWLLPQVVTARNRTDALMLRDAISTNTVTVPYNGDWVVAVFDLDNRKLTLYDKNKNVLGSLDMTPGSYDEKYFDLGFGEDNNYYGNTYKVYVDWIALRIRECPR